MNSPASWITVGAAIFAVRFVASEAFFERSSVKRGRMIFPPVLGIRILFNLGISGGIFVASRIAQTEGVQHNWFLILFCVSSSIACFVLMPGTITITKNSLIEAKWFGMRRISIDWFNVEYVFSSPVERLFTIVGKDGNQITHGPYHVDRDGFRDALRKYCSKFQATQSET